MNRRQFIRTTAAGALALDVPRVFAETVPASRSALTPAERYRSHRKLIVVVFGGGTRFSESIGDPRHRYIPRLWNELAPRGTLFTNVRVEGKIVHTNCTASILTGHREYDDDNDWSRPVAHPSLFEQHRKARQAGDTSAWAFVYASILAQCGLSTAEGFGPGYAANIVEPPTITRAVADEMNRLMQEAAAGGSAEAELAAARRCARLARERARFSEAGLRSDDARRFLRQQCEIWRSSDGTTSHDAFLTDAAVACMEMFAPDVITVAFGEIDCAHYGSWSRYVEAIARTDELTRRLWRAAEELDAYRGQTLVLVLPDHGRELDRPGGMGFVHHSDFYTGSDVDEGCRRVWLLALGAGVAAGRKVHEATPALSVAATGLEYLGLSASPGAGRSILNQL